MTRRTRLLRPLALLLAGAALADGVSLRNGRADPPKDPLGEGSKLIKGPDCGRAKLVIPKFAHARKVGELAGTARGVATTATAVADSAAASVTKAKALADKVSSNEGLNSAITDVEKVATAVTAAAGKLETELGTFKGKVGTGTLSGEKVERADMTKLRKLTEEAEKATKLVHTKLERLVEKTKDAAKKAEKEVAEAAKAASGVLAKAEKTLGEAKDIEQKAKWAGDDADALLKIAEKVTPKIDSKIADAEEQAPVYKALKDNVDSAVTAVTDAQGKVTTAAGDLKKAVPDLEKTLTPLEAAVKDLKSGSTKTDFTSKDAQDAEKAHDAVADALQKLKDEMSGLGRAQEDLKAKLDEAAAKLKD